MTGLTHKWISRFTELKFDEIDVEVRLMISEKNELIQITVRDSGVEETNYNTHWWLKGANPTEEEVLLVSYEMVLSTNSYKNLMVKNKLKEFLNETNS